MSGQTTSSTPRLSELAVTVDDVHPPDDESESDTGTCRICALDGPVSPVTGTNGVFSNSFTSSHELDDGDGICWRCEYMAGATDYRRYHWVATRDEIRVVKERPELLGVLLDPPSGPWMAKYKDESDFLTILNAWMFGQTLNTSRDEYRILVDKKLVHIDRREFTRMVAFAQKLRQRENEPSKRALKGPVRAGDLSRYDLRRQDVERINNDLAGREDWRIAVQLVQ